MGEEKMKIDVMIVVVYSTGFQTQLLCPIWLFRECTI